MKRTLGLLLLFFVQIKAQVQSNPIPFRTFNDFRNKFVEEYFQLNPEAGLYAGNYTYAGQISISDNNFFESLKQFNASYQSIMLKMNYAQLSPNDKIDFKIIGNILQKSNFYTDTLQEWKWNPSIYNVGDVIQINLNENYKPLKEKIFFVEKILEKIPAYYESAQKNIDNPTPEHTQLAINQNEGIFSLFNSNIPDSVQTLKQRNEIKIEEIERLSQKTMAAKSAIENYINFLKKLKPQKSYSIGKELFLKKFNYEMLTGRDAETTYANALQRKMILHKEMLKLSKELWTKYMGKESMPKEDMVLIKKVIDKISEKHVNANDFVQEIKNQIPILSNFVVDKELITIDPKKPLIVRETPEYMRGVAGASINAPGPFDKNGNTYYNVTPLSVYKTDKEKESYLREYNHYVLQILNIHEAIPGHYTQLVYANRAPSVIKSIFGNNAMIEGWAVYSELMMLENGYGNSEPEMWLMYYKWNLRSVCNTLLDYKVHVLNISEAEAKDLLINEAFQQMAEADGKWLRAKLTSVQLSSYFGGFNEIINLRDEIKKFDDKNFNLKNFHEEFLSYGSAPIKDIKDLMWAKRKAELKRSLNPKLNNLKPMDDSKIKSLRLNKSDLLNKTPSANPSLKKFPNEDKTK
jgi:hypothetical protein